MIHEKNKLSDKESYKAWITDLKNRFRQFQLKAVVQVNSELLNFYWELGKDIVEKQELSDWGDKFLLRLSKDLMAEFPDVKGFSKRNLFYIRKWYLFFSTSHQIVQQAVALITKIPWGHNIAIISKCDSVQEAFFYIQNTITHNWSRNILIHQMDTKLYERSGKIVSNFAATLPEPQSDLAQQTLKDPYIFDFITLTEDYTERELEKELATHLTHFLLELGTGFAFLGKQVRLSVNENDFYLDLLFYHTNLHAYIVIELKTGEFKPEFAGKMNFYLKAVDMKFKTTEDNPSIGILLCKTKDRTIVEYALSDLQKPIGVSEYQLVQALPENLKSSLPSIQELEDELNKLES